jgi:predicted DNA-binding protein
MTLAIHIKDLINSTTEAQLISIRLPNTTVNTIDELAAEIGALRSDLIVSFIDAGIDELEKQLSVTRDSAVSEIENSEGLTNGDVRYFLLNTNWNNSKSDHYTMLENEEASAFYGNWKKNIDYLREGDCVLLYHSGRGICAYGFASKELVKRDHEGHINECHSRRLNEFKRIKKPITAKTCKDVTKSNLNFRKTMSQLTKAQGEALIAVINQNL